MLGYPYNSTRNRVQFDAVSGLMSRVPFVHAHRGPAPVLRGYLKPEALLLESYSVTPQDPWSYPPNSKFTMHQCLVVNEILSTIFQKFLNDSEPSALAALARTCRAFSGACQIIFTKRTALIYQGICFRACARPFMARDRHLGFRCTVHALRFMDFI